MVLAIKYFYLATYLFYLYQLIEGFYNALDT